MKRTLILLLLSSAFVLLPVGLGQAASWHPCGSIPGVFAWNIREKATSCKRARKVVRKAVRKMMSSGSWDGVRARGFKCWRSGSYYDGAYYKCKRGRARVRFAAGG